MHRRKPLGNFGQTYSQPYSIDEWKQEMNQQYLIWYRRPNQHWAFVTTMASNKRDAMTGASVPRDATAYVSRVADIQKFMPKQDAFPWVETSTNA